MLNMRFASNARFVLNMHCALNTKLISHFTLTMHRPFAVYIYYIDRYRFANCCQF